MKKGLMGSRKFRMVLVTILGVFFVAASLLLLFGYSDKTADNGIRQETSYVEQAYAQQLDHSFGATKERVDSINANYGQQVKSAFSGEKSVVEKMIWYRIVFGTIKNILLYAILILFILLILVKGFNLSLFKRKLIEEGAEEPKKQESQPENKPINRNGCKKSASEPMKKDKAVDVKQAVEKEKSADEKEVVSGCQLP